MTQIIAFSGKKQSGKNTLSNFLHAYQMKTWNIIQGFEISDKGELIVETFMRDERGKIVEAKGLMDVTRLDIEYVVWAMDNIWPYVKHYAFATALKEVLMSVFNIDKDILYGTDEQKNTPTKYKWEDMPTKVKGKSGFMTAREFMQYFGTDICRKIYSGVWIDRAIRDIEAEQSKLAIISDVRFEDEVLAIQNAGGKVIRLTRSLPGEDVHESELALDKYEGFDAVIDNANMTIEESCKAVLEVLEKWDCFGAPLLPAAPIKGPRKPSTTSIKK
jgi:hypothetical protein